MRRLETERSSSLRLVLEWDEDTETVAIAQGAVDETERDMAYERLIRLQGIMREQGMHWLDMELMERHRPVCGVRGMALVWRAEMRSDGGARKVAELVAMGLGANVGRIDELGR